MDEKIPLLELRNVNLIYPDKYHAIHDVSYEIGPGLLVGLIGPNGCGKTTMMKCINKTRNISLGDILIDGKSISNSSPKEIAKKIANVPAEFHIGFGLTVFETVMMGRYPYVENMWWESDDDEESVNDALKKFGVYHLRDREFNILSSGEQQRVLIAKAYVQQPRLMLIDEPTSHLDMKYKLDVMEYLTAMVRRDMTILVAEHDLSLMARYCDICVIMKKGSVIAIGKPKEIITAELIQDVYGVSASVGLDDDDELYILPKRYRVGRTHI